MTECVLDASVAAKWVLPLEHERLAAEAIQFQQEFRSGRLKLIVPDLFWLEMGNILWKAVRSGRLTETAAEDSFDAFELPDLVTQPSQPLLKRAFAIATEFNRSFYDATYVALAVAVNAPLVTADERLVNALGARFPVRWLGSL